MARTAKKTTPRKPAAKPADPAVAQPAASAEGAAQVSPEAPAQQAPTQQSDRVRFDDSIPGAPAFDLIGRQARRDAKSKRLYWLLPPDLAERADNHAHIKSGRVVRAR